MTFHFLDDERKKGLKIHSVPVLGAWNLVELSDQFGVETFIQISTDKAVNPTSVMGVSKRIAEMAVKHMNAITRTRFMVVRFGNVLGSSGSVVPLFKEQIGSYPGVGNPRAVDIQGLTGPFRLIWGMNLSDHPSRKPLWLTHPTPSPRCLR